MFQTVGAATGTLRRPSCVLVEGTSMPWRSAERRFARPEMPATESQHDYISFGQKRVLAMIESTKKYVQVCVCPIKAGMEVTQVSVIRHRRRSREGTQARTLTIIWL